MEPTINVIAVYIFEGLEDCLHFSVGEMVDNCKEYLPSEAEKERDTVNKDHIFLQIYIFM